MARKGTIIAAVLAATLAAGNARAAHDEDAIPYWGSLRTAEANLRVGPGESYRINWVYRRQHLPVKVLRAMEGWRLVEDPDGARGWILGKFVSQSHWGYVVGRAPAPMRQAPDDSAQLLWRLSPGVVTELGDCAGGWCQVTMFGRGGFVREGHIWGTAPLKPEG